MSKRIRFTALLLAVSLFLNTASLPVTAEGALDSTLFTQEESVPTTAETQYTTAPQETVTETAAAASEAPTEAPTEATTEVTTEATTEATEGTIEATTEATEETTEATTGETEEATEATDATEETTEATTEAPQEPIRGKVVCTTSVNIRSGPGTGYEILGSAYNEDVVYVYEIAHMEDADWGRIGEGRWICLTYVILEGTDPTEGTEATEATDATEATQATEETTEATTEATEPTEESKETEATEPTEATDSTESTEATDATELPELEAEPALLNLDGPVPNLTVDEAKNLPIDQGHMDLYWWAAVCNKTITWKDKTATVSALAEEPVDAAPAEEETAPTEESTVPGTEETTVPVTEETTIPASEETTVPVTEETTVPATAETTTPSTEETTVPVTEAATVPVTEAATVPETTAASADIQSLSDAEVVAFSETENITTTTDTRNLIPANRTLEILDAKDLICLSYVNPEYYQDLILDIGVTGNSVDIKVSSDQPYTFSRTDESGNPIVETLYFQGLGGVDAPFQGTVEINATATGTIISLDKPLFVEVDTCAAICSNEKPLNLKYAKAEENNASPLLAVRPNALLAERVVSHLDENSNPITKPWYLSLSTTQEGESIPGLLPLMDTMKTTGSTPSSASIVFMGDVSVVTENANKLAPVVTGSGFLCNTMENGTSLTFSGISSIPEVQNTTSSAGTGGLVGTIGAGSQLTLPALTLGAVSSSSGDVGGLVGSMEAGALLTSSAAITLGAVTATDGNAGGLVGSMADSAALALSDATLTLNNVTASGTNNAGGLVGYALNPNFGILPKISGLESIAVITGCNAGGLVGSMEISVSNAENARSLPLQSLMNLTIVGTNNSGGLFGLLVNTGSAYTIGITDNESTETSNVTITLAGASSSADSNAGGLIGTYAASQLTDSLILRRFDVTSTLSQQVGNYGGMIGYVRNENSEIAYIHVDGATVSTTTTFSFDSSNDRVSNHGGLICELGEAGNMVRVSGEVTVKASRNGANQFTGTNKGSIGGIVGKMPAGVLMLECVPNLTNAVPYGANKAQRGWILGNRNNTLVYTTVSNDAWVIDTTNGNSQDNTYSNDVGVWGQVLRYGDDTLKTPVDVEGQAQETDLLTFDPAAHTVTVRSISYADGKYEISNPRDFAALSLRLQVDETTNGALRFGENHDDLSGSDVSIFVKAPINLSDTGLTSLTRDISSTPVFNLTIEGKTADTAITLPDLTVYCSNEGHNRQGLIGVAKELNVTNLTVDGNMTLRALDSAKVFAGALLAEAKGKTTMTGVTSSIKMEATGTGDGNCAYSGFVAATNSDCKEITFSGCKLAERSYITDQTTANSYAAGFLALGNHNNGDSITTVNVKENCVLSGNITMKAAPNYARIGGLIATLYNQTSILNISDLTVKDLYITGPQSENGNTCGGLLGYEWMETTATIQGITFEDCMLHAGNSSFGGLVYKSSGIWQVKANGTDAEGKPIPGIQFSSKVVINGASSKETPSGLLVCRGDKVINSNNTDRGALYMEIQDGAYKIVPNSVSITLTSDSQYFDEIVGITEGNGGDGNDKNGIVSYATAGHAPIDPENGNRNTYENVTSNTDGSPWLNTKTRYYYNLDLFRENGLVDGTVDSAEKMVLMSAGLHCDGSIKEYFIKSLGTITDGENPLDLTGYSYYPVPLSQDLTISNATITFDYDNLQVKESGNHLPSGVYDKYHHKGMHTGIFTDVFTTENSGTKTLTISNLTLAGVVGGSAIICGEAKGNSASAMTVLNIHGVILDGIRTLTPEGIGKIPLLIYSIGNYTSMTMSGVTTNAIPTTAENGTQTYPYDDLDGDYAATSLIGNVGNSADGKYISLTFDKMGLDGRIPSSTGTPNSRCKYGTTGSIFSTSLFLTSFQYSDGSTCSGTYNFVKGENYTEGVELSNTTTGRNKALQYCFFRSTVYVYAPEGGGTDEGAAAYYSPDKYLRYVFDVEGEKGTTYHEIDINLESPDLDDGCGTYSHPYRIRNARQLIYLAKALDTGPIPGWEINMCPDVLNVPNNPDFSKQGAGHDVNVGSGDLVYTATSGDWTYKKADGTNATVKQEKVLAYLRNAYYRLEGPTLTQEEIDEGKQPVITLSAKDWTGLGNASTSGAFSGVIVGKTGVTLQIEFNGTSKDQFGGLIKFSQGSVVKDVTIEYLDAPRITAPDGAPSNDQNARFFGGVVGWCIGGDTIIDNVTVTYNGAPVASGANGYLAAIGGYVGLVGGYASSTGEEELGGGVVFRNMNSNSHPGLTVPTGKENYFYFNPYVGRVLDGYAMGEGTQLENTNKNYYIPQILSGTHLTRTRNDIHVQDGAGLWLLSAIANSGAGHMGFSDAASRSNAYNYGKPRTKDYEQVGKVLSDTNELYDEAYLGGVASPKDRCYLTSKYTTGDFSQLTVNNNNYYFHIYLDGNCDVSGFKNGFRGIGTSYGAKTSDGKNKRLLRVMLFDGNNYTVNLDQDRKEYLDEAGSWISVGTGMFIQLCVRTKDLTGTPTFQDLTLMGQTGITYYQGTNPATNDNLISSNVFGSSLYSTRFSQAGAGMLAATLAKNSITSKITFSNVQLVNASVNPGDGVGGTTFAGGLIGAVYSFDGSNYFEAINLVDCAYSSLTVRGFVDAGGFFGRVRSQKDGSQIHISYTKNTNLTAGSITSTSTSFNKTYFGFGALIGCTDRYGLTIGPNEDAKLIINGLTLRGGYAGDSGDKAFGGGLVGLCYNPQSSCTIRNVTMTGDISISGSDSSSSKRRHILGGLIGALTNDLSNWNNSGTYSVTVSNVHVAESDSMKIQYAQQAGGLIGILKAGGQVNIQNVHIGPTAPESSDSPSLVIEKVSSNEYSNIGGLVGGGNALKSVSLDGIQIADAYVIMDKTATKRGAALLFGFLENCSGVNNPRIDIRNTSLKNCVVATGNKITYAGFLYGYLNKGDSIPPHITGSNILIKDCKVGYDTSLSADWSNNSALNLIYDGTNTGIIGGYCTNNAVTVKLVGVSLRNNESRNQYFGDTAPASGSYVIRADYLADTSGTAGSAYPHVTTSPVITLTKSESAEDKAFPNTLTGDGAVFYDGKSMAEAILKDSSSSNYYNLIPEAKTWLTEKPDVFSTFNDAGENGTDYTGNNFPVLLISENTTDAINNLVAAYISVMTNHVEYTTKTVESQKVFDKCNYSGLFSITPTTYKWDSTDQKFKEAAAGTHTLTFSNGKLSINNGRYDNQLNQFTLLDVAYYDPADSTKNTVAYHLYIPVVVKKVLLFKVWFSAKEGTDYYTSIYDSQEYAAMASHGDQVTTLITFEYEWTTAEWENALNNGAGLNWNFPKTLQIKDVNSGGIPSGTKLTLVDRNNQNKAYFTTSGGLSPDGNGYISFKLQEQFNGFSEVKLWELLTLNAVESTAEQVGQYVEVGDSVGDSASDTIQIGDKYYRPITEDEKAQETPPTCYYLEVKGFKSETQYAREQYYLTIQTPKTSSEFVYLILQHKSRLDNPNGNGLPSDRIAATDDPKTATPQKDLEKGVSLNGDENVILISNFFKQELTVTTTSNEQLMSDTNRSITGTLKTVISFNSETDKGNYLRYTQGRSLHQCFELYLKSMNNGTGTTVSFDEGASLTVGGKAVPLNGGTRVQVYSEAIKWDESSNSKTVSCDFTLTYTLAGISSQFPIRANDTDEIGIQVNATSKLSYVEDMSQTSMEDSEADETGNLFYQKDLHLATLTYNAYENAYGTQRYGWSQLGINDLDSNGDYQILSAALYDVHELTNASSADKLKISVKLLQKTDDGDYVDVSEHLSSYLNSITVSLKGNPTVISTAAASVRYGAAEFRIADTGFNSSVPIEIDVDMNVITGAAFEKAGLTYANYKLVLKAELLQGSKTIEGSPAEDYIIYTNAKIIPTLVS